MKRIVVVMLAAALALGTLSGVASAQEVAAGTLPPITWDYIFQYNLMDLGKAVGASKLTSAQVATILKPQCKGKSGTVMTLSVDGAQTAQDTGVFEKVDVPKKAAAPQILDPEGSYGTWQVGCKIRFEFRNAKVGKSYQGTIQGLSPINVSLKELKHYKYFLFSSSYPGQPCSYNKQQGLVCT